jgi:hypothetical protein
MFNVDHTFDERQHEDALPATPQAENSLAPNVTMQGTTKIQVNKNGRYLGTLLG